MKNVLKQQLTYNLIKLVSTKLWATTKTKERQSTRDYYYVKGNKKAKIWNGGTGSETMLKSEPLNRQRQI